MKVLGHTLSIQQLNLRMKRGDIQPATHHRLAEGGETDIWGMSDYKKYQVCKNGAKVQKKYDRGKIC